MLEDPAARSRSRCKSYTAEPDFLFVLDMTTGAIVQRVALKSGPEEIVDKDGKLYVRTYDRDYVFALR